MSLRAAWTFLAGESRSAPAGVVIAIAAALGMHAFAPGAGVAAGVIFVAILAAALIAAVFEGR